MLTSSSPRLLVTRSVFGPAMVTCAMTGWPVRGRMCAAEACNSNGSAAEEERTIVPRSRTAIGMPGAWRITALLSCSRENWLAPRRTRNHPRESVASVSPLKIVAPVAATPEPTEAFCACRTTPSAAEGEPYIGASTSVTTRIATRQLRNSACKRTSESNAPSVGTSLSPVKRCSWRFVQRGTAWKPRLQIPVVSNSARQQRTSQPCGPVAPASADPNLVSNPMPSPNRLFKQVPQAWSFGRVNREILFEACGDFLQAPLDVVIERLHDLGDLFALHRLLARVEVCPDGGAGFGFVELHFKGH